MFNRSPRSKKSLFTKLFFPTFTMLLLQSLLLTVVIHYGGTFNRLRANAYDMLTNQVTSTASTIETQFNLKWTDLNTEYSTITKIFQDRRSALGLDAGIITGPEQKKLLAEFAPTLIRLLRQNSVNGVFVILNDSDTYQPLSRQGNAIRNGICIRDLDQNASYVDKEDLIIERAPASIIPQLGLVLDSWWEANYVFNPENYNAFYEMPLIAAKEHPEADYDDLAYFSKPYHLSENDTEIVSYSVPLRDDAGVVFGVLGVEISTKYLASLLPNAELSGQQSGAYALVQKQPDSEECQVFVYSGTFYKQVYLNQRTLIAGETLSKNCYQFLSPDADVSVCGSMKNIQVYNANTPFSQQRFYLVGLVDQDYLLEHIQYAEDVWTVALCASVILGIVSLIFISKQITKPIMRLSQKMTQADAKSECHLEAIGIREIDQLTDSIEHLNQTVNMNRAKNEFFSRMSHDLRTPMNAIIGFSSEEFICNATEEQKNEYLKSINTSGKYMLGLVNEILDVSKISNQKMRLHCTRASIRAPFDIVVQIIGELARTKGVTFLENTDTLDSNLFVNIDVQRTQQVFINLLSNAVKFTDAGGTVSLHVDKQAVDTDASITLIVRITDSGRGMSEEFQNKMFEQFSQEADMAEGTGLGLSIAKGLVDLMGGSIQCKSAVGVGTEFTVTLVFPTVESAVGLNGQDSAPSISNRLMDSALCGKRILVCEDHPVNMQITVKLLENKGIRYDTALNGQLAVEQYLSQSPGTYDAILMDVRMPVMDGIQATAAIRSSLHGDAATIPILAMTANAFDEDIQNTRDAGMDAHIAKPVIPGILYENLYYFINRCN